MEIHYRGWGKYLLSGNCDAREIVNGSLLACHYLLPSADREHDFQMWIAFLQLCYFLLLLEAALEIDEGEDDVRAEFRRLFQVFRSESMLFFCSSRGPRVVVTNALQGGVSASIVSRPHPDK